jgi:hypothetical protein
MNYLDIAKRWLRLADSYDFVDRLDLFIRQREPNNVAANNDLAAKSRNTIARSRERLAKPRS